MERTTPKFDRTVSQIYNPCMGWYNPHQLGSLRVPGNARRLYYSKRWEAYHSAESKGFKKRLHCSMALRQLVCFDLKPGIYLDLGCGNSADAWIMKEEYDCYAFGLDLYPPDPIENERGKGWATMGQPPFVQCDLTQQIPFASNSVKYATCSAVVDLIEPGRRQAFYNEVYRVLEPRGVFGLSITKLVAGYGFTMKEERDRIWEAGFCRANGELWMKRNLSSYPRL